MLEIQPQNADIHYKIATIYADQKKINDSLFWLKEALKRGFNRWELVKSDRNMNEIVQIIARQK